MVSVGTFSAEVERAARLMGRLLILALLQRGPPARCERKHMAEELLNEEMNVGDEAAQALCKALETTLTKTFLQWNTNRTFPLIRKIHHSVSRQRLTLLNHGYQIFPNRTCKPGARVRHLQRSFMAR